VTDYPEIGDLTKLQDPAAEVTLEASRPDPVATQAGTNVSYVKTSYNDSGWQQINLPHDWVVGCRSIRARLRITVNKAGISGSTSANTIAWYRHTFTLPVGDTNKAVWLEFDGIYRNALIWLNGRCIGRDVSGYAPIAFDVTTNVIAGGTNVLVVRVDASRFEGWFYEGAGIYRHVWLEKSDPVHVAHWGTYVATSLVGSNATITVQTAVTNQSSSANGQWHPDFDDSRRNSNAVTAVTSNLTLTANQGLIVTQTLAVANANLWSLQTPYLYNLASTVSNQSVAADVCHHALRHPHGAIRLHQWVFLSTGSMWRFRVSATIRTTRGWVRHCRPAAILPGREIEGDGVQRLPHLAQHADGGTA